MPVKTNLVVMCSLGALLATGLSGCSDPADALVQRDVYTGKDAVERCIADWGNEELCTKKISDEEAKKLAEQNRSNGSHGGVFIFPGSGYGVYGPSYSGDNRTVTHNGTTYSPTTSKSNNVAAFKGISPKATPSFSAPGKSFSGRTVSTVSSRGGFGSTGRGMSSSS